MRTSMPTCPETIELIGAYLPRLTPERVVAFAEHETRAFLSIMRALRRKGISAIAEEELVSRAELMREEMVQALSEAALFEVKVSRAAPGLELWAFHDAATTHVAWEPAWLSESGEEVLCESQAGPPDAPAYRVAFYIHGWSERSRLRGPRGEMHVASFQPVPERLWKLAPYALVD